MRMENYSLAALIPLILDTASPLAAWPAACSPYSWRRSGGREGESQATHSLTVKYCGHDGV